MTGFTGSTDFPTTPGAFDTSYNGGSGIYGDAYVAHLAQITNVYLPMIPVN